MADETDLLEAAGLWTLLALGAFSLLLMLAALLGLFHGPVVLGAAALVIFGMLSLHRRRPPLRHQAGEAERSDVGSATSAYRNGPWPLVGLLTLLAAMAWLYLPPGEFVLGGLDPGVYLNSGAALAASGSFYLRDSLLADAGASAQAVFVAQDPGALPHLYPGFFWNFSRGAAVTQFPFLLTVWTAVGILVAGPLGGLSVPALVSMLAVVFFFLLARRLLGPLGGYAAAVLLAFNAVQLWHGRLSFSEELLQLFLFAGLWAGLRWRQEGHAVAALASGIALGALPLIKPEAVVLGLLALTALHWLPGPAEKPTAPVRPPGHKWHLPQWSASGPWAASFWAPYGVGSLLACINFGTAARPIVLDLAVRAGGLLLLGMLLTAAFFLTLKLALKAGPLVFRGEGLLQRWRPPNSLAYSFLALPALAAAGFAYAESRAEVPPSFLGALWNGLFLSPLDGLLLALTPWAILQARPIRSRPVVAIVGVLLAAGLLYLAVFFRYYESRDHLHLFMWATRRLLPAVLPLLALVEAWALLRLAGLLPTRVLPLFLGGLLLLLAARWPDLAPVAAAREYDGGLHAVEELAAQTEAEAVLLLDDDEAGVRFATPLALLAYRDSYVAQGAQDAAAGVDALIAAARAAGRPVYYFSSRPGGVARALQTHLPALVGRWSVDLPELERTSTARPRRQNRFHADFALFRVGADDAARSWTLPLVIDLGEEDFSTYALLREGFFPREVSTVGMSYRWTERRASLTIPPEVKPRWATLSASAGRPDAALPVEVTLSCGGEEQARLSLGNGFTAYTVELGPRCRSPGEGDLTLETSTWSPYSYELSADRRRLGLMLASITLH